MDLDLFGVIDRKTNATVKAALQNVGEDELKTRIDSEGGSVFDGLSIFSALQSHPGAKTCLIESAAFSIASYIAMAFDTVEITSNGYMMIHNPSMTAEGEASDMTAAAELLDKLRTSMVDAYANKTKMPREAIEAMMDKETFLNAEEALQAGFVDKILDRETPSQVETTAHMPFRAVASLKGSEEPESGETLPEREEPMADKNVATVKAIRKRYPKASAEFIVKAMDEEMAMEDVDAAINAELQETVAKLTAEMDEMKAENEELKAKAKAMEDEEPSAMDDEEPSAMDDDEPEAMDDDDEPEARRPAAKARPGTRPVARRRSGGVNTQSARAEWQAAIEKYEAKGMARPKAVQAANKANPGLRERMMKEAGS